MQSNEKTSDACKMAEVWRLNNLRNKKIAEEQQRLQELNDLTKTSSENE